MPSEAALKVGLSAVIVAVVDGEPRVLAIPARGKRRAGLPFGPFDPIEHRTFELGLRGWVLAQTGFSLAYVEQLYTFGDRGRDLPEASFGDGSSLSRIVSVGYLALTRDAAAPDATFDAEWEDWYRFFPWEDHRQGRPALIDADILPELNKWAGDDTALRDRVEANFAHEWAEERALDRYELLYEAGLVEERHRATPELASQPRFGEPMESDHRRILATAISRLRGKLRYRPIIFELMPERFTLFDLQRTAEGILGLPLHKQNFRRAIDKAGFVTGTGEMVAATGGRPAELFRYADDAPSARARLGIPTPILRTD